MNSRRMLLVIAIAALGIWLSIRESSKNSNVAEHAEKTEDFERGPHRGRLLRDGNFAIEITIFEDNAPPQFRLYAYDRGKPIAGSDVQVDLELSRLGGEVNIFKFSPKADYLEAGGIVAEPHSFDVKVEARYQGNASRWAFSSYEGRTTIVPESAQAAGIKTESAGPAPILEKLSLSGHIAIDPSRTAQIRARFSGIVREIRKKVGERVVVGDVLAIVENNDSLQLYPIKSPIGGIIMALNSNVGDVTNENPLFTVADLSEVWAAFHIFPKDLSRVKTGQKIKITSMTGDVETSSTVTMVSPVADSASQTVFMRTTFKNNEGLWPSGMAVSGELILNERVAPLAVKTTAVQRFRDFDVVFAQVDDTYEVRMLNLGADDGTMVEVLSGLKPGTAYVSENSFLIKADIEKSGASHDH